jgi:hypothetical protein
MIGNKYGIAYVDSSFLLTRNTCMATKDKQPEEMEPGSIIRLTIQTLRKLSREWGITASKILLIGDQWSRDYGGYYTNYLIKDFQIYKGSRKFITEQDLEDMRCDPNVTQEELDKAIREFYMNRTKFAAKKAMKEDFKDIGVYYYGKDGYEFDNIATLAAFQRWGHTDKPDVIITKDSDLQYSLTPGPNGTVFFSLPTKGSEPKVITYEEMYETIPQVLRDRGVSLYMYNAYLNAFGKGHNDLGRCLKPGVDHVEAILHILDGNYSDINNVDFFNAQMKSYDLGCYPGIEEVQRAIANDFETKGKLGTLDDFHMFCSKHGVNGISDRYYSDFISTFDPKFFTDR